MDILDDVTKLAGLSGGGLTGNSALLQGVLQMLGSGASGGGLASMRQGADLRLVPAAYAVSTS